MPVCHSDGYMTFGVSLYNSLASALFLLGVALIYKHTGVLDLDLLLSMNTMQSLPGSPMVFILAALAMKLMLFPLNAWAKNLIGIRGGIAPAFITVLMPMVFVFDLQKLSGLLSARSIALLSALAAITLLFYLFRLFRPNSHWRADLVFATNAVFILGFALHYYIDSFYLLLTIALFSSGLKLAILSAGNPDDSAEEISARPFELNLNNSVLALLTILIIFFLI